jgi:2-amino-4-hydroxy-6-hydroxymethyldihydropteridine diphosphokinase
MGMAWLALGANIGDPVSQLEQAIVELSEHPDITVLARSSIIVTAPWGKTDQPDFHNMAVAIETSLSPLALLDVCIGIEARMGRIRLERWGPRLIDIDIVACEGGAFESPTLTLPHPRAHERDFVLIPLREIAPEVADWIVRRANETPNIGPAL